MIYALIVMVMLDGGLVLRGSQGPMDSYADCEAAYAQDALPKVAASIASDYSREEMSKMVIMHQCVVMNPTSA